MHCLIAIDIKELQSILDDDSISSAEHRYVKEAMKRFTKHQNRGIVEGADVVGMSYFLSIYEGSPVLKREAYLNIC
jgi:hypothetical protein